MEVKDGMTAEPPVGVTVCNVNVSVPEVVFEYVFNDHVVNDDEDDVVVPIALVATQRK
jgi:hypothetical protein